MRSAAARFRASSRTSSGAPCCGGRGQAMVRLPVLHGVGLHAVQPLHHRAVEEPHHDQLPPLRVHHPRSGQFTCTSSWDRMTATATDASSHTSSGSASASTRTSTRSTSCLSQFRFDVAYTYMLCLHSYLINFGTALALSLNLLSHCEAFPSLPPLFCHSFSLPAPPPVIRDCTGAIRPDFSACVECWCSDWSSTVGPRRLYPLFPAPLRGQRQPPTPHRR